MSLARNPLVSALRRHCLAQQDSHGNCSLVCRLLVRHKNQHHQTCIDRGNSIVKVTSCSLRFLIRSRCPKGWPCPWLLLLRSRYSSCSKPLPGLAPSDRKNKPVPWTTWNRIGSSFFRNWLFLWLHLSVRFEQEEIPHSGACRERPSSPGWGYRETPTSSQHAVSSTTEPTHFNARSAHCPSAAQSQSP